MITKQQAGEIKALAVAVKDCVFAFGAAISMRGMSRESRRMFISQMSRYEISRILKERSARGTRAFNISGGGDE